MTDRTFSPDADAPLPEPPADSGEHRTIPHVQRSLYVALDERAASPRARAHTKPGPVRRRHDPLWDVRGPRGLLLCVLGLHAKVRTRANLSPVCARCRWEQV